MSVEALNYARRVKVGNTTAKFVLTRLADRADERYSCFPAVDLIAAEVETSERTVQRSLALLRELRLVSDKAAYRPDGSQTTSRYYLHGPWDQYGGTGVPFPEIVEPKQARAELWASPPAEGEFRDGTAAAVAVKGDQAEAEAAEQRAAEARARTAAAKESQRERGRKAAAAKRPGSTAADEAPEGSGEDVPAGDEGVTAMSPPPVTLVSPPPVTLMSPLESTATTHRQEGKTGVSAVGQSAGGFARAGESDSAAPKTSTEAGDSVADRKTHPARKQRPAQKITEARPVEGEAEAWQALDAVLAELGERRGTRPPTLRKAVRLLLGHDTDARGGTAFAAYPRRPEHVLGRLNRGWYRAHGPERAAAGYDGVTYGEPIRRPVGYLAEVLVGQDCAVPECELGVLLTTGEECRACEQREAERAVEAAAARLERETAQLAEQRKATEQAADDRFRLPEQRTTWHCEVPTCRRPGRGAPPEVLRCAECVAEAEETARLRAEIAAQHPELAATTAAARG